MVKVYVVSSVVCLEHGGGGAVCVVASEKHAEQLAELLACGPGVVDEFEIDDIPEWLKGRYNERCP